MLENLMELVKEHAQGAIVNNSAIPDEQNDAATEAASSSITDVLKEHATGGNMEGLASLFQGGGLADNPIVNQIKDTFKSKLGGMGIDADTAENTASSLIPGLVSQFTQHTNDPNNSSFNIQDILKTVTGGSGNFDWDSVKDIFGKVTGGGDAAQGGGEQEGGIMGTIKGLFK